MSSISGLDQLGWDSLFSGSINVPTAALGSFGSGPRQWDDGDIFTVAQRLLSGPGPSDPAQAAWVNNLRLWMAPDLAPLLMTAAQTNSLDAAIAILQQSPRTGPLIALLTGLAASGLDDDDDWGEVGQTQRGPIRV